MPAFFALLRFFFPPLFVRLSWFPLAHFTQMYYSDHCCKWIRINFLSLNNSYRSTRKRGVAPSTPLQFDILHFKGCNKATFFFFPGVKIYCLYTIIIHHIISIHWTPGRIVGMANLFIWRIILESIFYGLIGKEEMDEYRSGKRVGKSF